MRRTNFQGNVHVINFPASTAAAELAALFDEYGVVLGAQIKSIPADGGNMRLGIVAIAPDKAADKAIAALQGYALNGQKLKLKKAKPPVVAEKKKAPKPAARIQRPLSIERAAAAAEGADWYPSATHAAPPRQVIVEYRGRRQKRVLG